MSTVQKVNWEPLSDFLKVQPRDYPLADGTLADPSNAVCLVDGEYLTFDANSKLVRACDVTNTSATATALSFPNWAERGRTDVQAMANRKSPIVQFGEFEADTRIYDATKVVNNGLAITAVLQPLKVATIVLGTRNYVGLVGHGTVGSDTDPIVGLVTKLPANNGGKLRYMRFWKI
jgi:hypothetical protein